MAQPIHLTDEQLEELRAKGLPLVVTLDDGSEVVVQDPKAYKRMLQVLEDLDIAESARICQKSWEDMESGRDPGIPAREFIEQLRRRTRHAG